MKLRHLGALATALTALTLAAGCSSPGDTDDDNDKKPAARLPAAADIRVLGCGTDSFGITDEHGEPLRDLTARVRVTNKSVKQSYDYTFSVRFQGAPGTKTPPPTTGTVERHTVSAGEGETFDVVAGYKGKGDGSEYGKCAVVTATKTPTPTPA